MLNQRYAIDSRELHVAWLPTHISQDELSEDSGDEVGNESQELRERMLRV